MNLFDKLVSTVLESRSDLNNLRITVEKELLHLDILRIMRDNNFLKKLTFIGGTCLRICYGGVRLSEDLDFTGGQDFSKSDLSNMSEALKDSLERKYGLEVQVSEPIKETGNTNSWKIKIETRPGSKSEKSQRINIDICALASYEKKACFLLNHYEVEMGVSGLIIQGESLEEIYVDKLIALAFRNRIQYRDLWDIFWLESKGIIPRLEFIPNKLKDRNRIFEDFITKLDLKIRNLKENKCSVFLEFTNEMLRFLPQNHLKVLEQEYFWDMLIQTLDEKLKEVNHECLIFEVYRKVKLNGLRHECKVIEITSSYYEIEVEKKIRMSFSKLKCGSISLNPFVHYLDNNQSPLDTIKEAIEDSIYTLILETGRYKILSQEEALPLL
ncbi:Nucleotidyl transferase AbiEii/AbiGii toxin family protein (plasmid) [Candidatus Trichorickettsia mobilis]|uniref:nucleotidyl transferase AbiEii/AbiGii toxin family protein n=1 Tax=Candidatus Trichorickettsia mobilis TaxID=1346319 RepID=UPI002B25EAF6|nr:nucleotidyl transferase AbiEii/AbiGii toxin family protein [Candidatus Trichorickettsia mobilis]WPY01666.1 Nucleotidyl transferase AbiEii/AbiGii toxin family protein [Candidatus Trichorickettsia mobilis]